MISTDAIISEDGGIYVCHAKNVYGEIERNVSVTVLKEHFTASMPKNYTFNKNDINVKIDCNVVPESKSKHLAISWYHESDLINANTTKDFQVNLFILVLKYFCQCKIFIFNYSFRLMVHI